MLAAVACAGCAEKLPAVFDKTGIDGIGTLLIVPLQSAADPSAGPVVSGMLTTRLRAAKLPKLTIVVPPQIWRLDPKGPANGAQVMTDDEAKRIARDMAADAVLTGTVTYSVKLATAQNMPGSMEESMKDIDFQQDFAARQATATVNLRILSIKANRAVYAHGGTAGGTQSSEHLMQAAQEALKPFEDYVRASR